MALSKEHRRFLVVQQSLVPAIINIALNGAIAWLLMRHNPFLTLWDEGATGPDLLITGFLLAFLSCMIVTPLVQREIAGGKLPPLPQSGAADGGLHRKPLLARAALLGVAGIGFGALPAIAGLTWLGVEPMSVGWFVTFKSIWAGVLAAAVTPLIAWWALRAASISPSRS